MSQTCLFTYSVLFLSLSMTRAAPFRLALGSGGRAQPLAHTLFLTLLFVCESLTYFIPS